MNKSIGDEAPYWGRGMALGLGLMLVGGSAIHLAGGFDFNLWLLDLRLLPARAADALGLFGGGLLVAWGIRPGAGPLRQAATIALAATFAVVALANAVMFWSLLGRGLIHTRVPVPLSGILAAVFGGIVWIASGKREVLPDRNAAWRTAATALGIFAVFPVLQVFAFGHTDYRRAADVIIVPGARVYADGTLSMAVADRVRTASELYKSGWARHLVVSGGPGDGAVHETEAMRAYAIRLGVAPGDIESDRGGLNTAATVADTLPGLRFGGRTQRALVVSEFYHLPRLKLAYQRAGVEVFTVPATPGHWLRYWPLRSILREIPGFWSYVVRPGITERTTVPSRPEA